uniref:Uncharacterized protein n=1 Tax=Romanomermis culicivorax TaxID=13658 RepID=A0A915KFL2_ROMCU
MATLCITQWINWHQQLHTFPIDVSNSRHH